MFQTTNQRLLIINHHYPIHFTNVPVTTNQYQSHPITISGLDLTNLGIHRKHFTNRTIEAIGHLDVGHTPYSVRLPMASTRCGA